MVPTADGEFRLRDITGAERTITWHMLGMLLFDTRTRESARRLHREAAEIRVTGDLEDCE